MDRRAAVPAISLVLLSACSTPAAPPSDGSGPSSSGASTVMMLPLPSGSPGAAATGAGTASAAASGEPAPAASAAASGEPAAAASAAASGEPAEKLPEVNVKGIGMHIGGGPHDEPTKLPIRQSITPHFDEMKRCFALVEDKKKGGDFGVDLLIDKAGGKAQVTHPRTTMKGAGFKECMVAVFVAIDFKKPRGGTTMVSYSVRFTP